MTSASTLVDLRPRRVMVTGGAGFIGSHLTRPLPEFGHEVLVLDNFYSGTGKHSSARAALRSAAPRRDVPAL